ncbi:hypothetical protein BKA70DRAFT_1421946 [Coprinopsis sp. MPI-PUGE-AT-0042]|nr:hypothetical protein BKA70DRAFT_1421946 [Coprinopsis sp. MPI-PUGE-AT-0042]
MVQIEACNVLMVDTFKGEGDDGLPFSLKNVVDEAMRLHPPSKHIGRMTVRSPFTSLPPNISNIIARFMPSIVYQREQASVQEILRTESIWGPDSHLFNPSRYSSDPDKKDEQAEALSYIFGGGNLRCIGSSWAPMAAAVVSSAIFDGLDRRQYTIVAEKEGWIVEMKRDEVIVRSHSCYWETGVKTKAFQFGENVAKSMWGVLCEPASMPSAGTRAEADIPSGSERFHGPEEGDKLLASDFVVEG